MTQDDHHHGGHGDQHGPGVEHAHGHQHGHGHHNDQGLKAMLRYTRQLPSM